MTVFLKMFKKLSLRVASRKEDNGKLKNWKFQPVSRVNFTENDEKSNLYIVS